SRFFRVVFWILLRELQCPDQQQIALVLHPSRSSEGFDSSRRLDRQGDQLNVFPRWGCAIYRGVRNKVLAAHDGPVRVYRARFLFQERTWDSFVKEFHHYVNGL